MNLSWLRIVLTLSVSFIGSKTNSIENSTEPSILPCLSITCLEYEIGLSLPSPVICGP